MSETRYTPPVKHKGAAAELVAAAFLLSEGYEVFRNVSQHGPADLVVWKDGEFTPVDVRSAYRAALADGDKKRYFNISRQNGVRSLGVDLETSECVWLD